MSGYIPELTPIGAGQLPMSPSYLQTLPLNRYFQYGTSMPSSGFDLSSLIAPVGGSILGAGLNFLGSVYQNYKQAQFYDKYMSPQARMEQMRAAGINPNAAAQGISGSSVPQMTAAQPNGAFTGIGEQLGNSVNTALSAANIVADTKQKEVQAEGQDIQNKIAEVELGMKPDMMTAELEETKAHAEEMRQNITNLKKELDRCDQEIKNLKAQELLIIAQEGQVVYDNRLKEAQTKREKAETALKKAQKEYYDTLKVYQEKENKNYLTPEERIQKQGEAQEKVVVAKAKAEVENNPELRSKQELTEQFERDVEEIEKEISDIERELELYDSGVKKDNYFGTNRSTLKYRLKSAQNRLENRKDKYYEDLRRYGSNESTSVGLHGVSRSK